MPLTQTERFQVQSSGFRGCNIPTLLMFEYDLPIGLFHPMGATAYPTLRILNPLIMQLSIALQPGTLNVEPLNLDLNYQVKEFIDSRTFF